MRVLTCAIVAAIAAPLPAADQPVPDYAKQIAPIFQKHCNGCHNADDHEGKLSLESFADLQKGGKRGPAVQPGEVNSSRLLLLVTGKAKPVMPPEDNDRLSDEEIALLTAWVKAGAKGPNGNEPVRRTLSVPKLKTPANLAKPVTALASTKKGDLLAVARFGAVEILETASMKSVRTIDGFPGKANSVEFSADGRMILVGTGVSGLYGRAQARSVTDGRVLKTFEGHRDVLYAARLSPDSSIVATAGYDRKITLWDFKSGKPVRTLSGHNGAIFDLAFNPDGTILASASADQTIKLWQVSTGVRLDTLGQPLKEQYVVRFSPDGKHVVAGGLDNRIRVWRVVSKDKPRINPLVYARIAHEGAIIQLGFTPNGQSLVSIADDQTMKLWDTNDYTQLVAFDKQPDESPALTMLADNRTFVVGRVDGSLESFEAQPGDVEPAVAVKVTPKLIEGEVKYRELAEAEPNDAIADAAAVSLPAKITGAIHAKAEGATTDADVFRFDAKAGEQWVFEVKAARNKSPLDSKIEVLDASGRPIPRVKLQAVRDSYINFRGIDSNTRNCRLHNWEEMDLNQYLYLNGEVVKLWLWPRGPDSGFDFYPHGGNRHTFFGTTAMAHALQEPAYIVEPHAPEKKLIPNGLPVFTINYENDDDSERELGNDSRLQFTAPADGSYLLRVTDVRGFQGEAYKYEVTARPAKPGFAVTLGGANPTINAGSGREFTVLANRHDGFLGEIRVNIDGLPPGFSVSSPIVIEANQHIAYGTINALSDAPQPTPENAKATKVTATATVNGVETTVDVNSFGGIKLADAPKILVAIGPDANDADKAAAPEFAKPNAFEITIAPGETVTARVHIKRQEGFNNRIGFEPLAQNLPHGIIVDHVGLNGLLIVEGTSERQFFITAADWVPETTRVFHLRSKEEGGQTSWPIIVHVKRK